MEKDYLKASVPTPGELMRMLDEWLEFPPPALRRGMESGEVPRLLGKPERYRESREGSLALRTEAFELATQTTEVDYVEGLVVRLRATSK